MNSNIMNADTQAQLGYVTQAPAPVDGVPQAACNGTMGCQRFSPVDNESAQLLSDFTAAANADLPLMQQAVNNSGHHYLDAEQMSHTSLVDVNRLAESEGSWYGGRPNVDR